jgi:quercetin dioxygenase-like cupin family protein
VTTFRPVAGLSPVVLAEGVVARPVEGERMTLAVVDLEPNAIVSEHRHENEQLGFCIKGSITMRIGDEVLELHAGDTYVIPSNIEHGAAAGPEGATITDVFAPTRADWRDKDHLEPKAGNWP